MIIAKTLILVSALLASYILGSVPLSYLAAKLTKGIDIRKCGSGNVGSTNVLRTAGRLPASLALVGDILKGVFAVTFLSRVFYPYVPVSDYELFCILMGMAVIIGHIWTVFLNFKGGKGVATSAGVLVILSPDALAVAAAVWLITVIFTRYISLGSILASLSLSIAAAAMGRTLQFVVFSIILCIISSYKHITNIKRLINGEESKLGQTAKIGK